MECPELQVILDPLDDDLVPDHVHRRIEEHFANCRNCQAAMSKFLQIGKIIEKTVYSENSQDDLLRYIRHLTGRNLRWASPDNRSGRPPKKKWLKLLLKVAAAFVIAAGLGASLAMILGVLGLIGSGKAPPVEIVFDPSVDEPVLSEKTSRPGSSVVTGGDSSLAVIVPKGGMAPDAVYDYINGIPPLTVGSQSESPSLSPEDSTRLRNMEAELSAFRDALARDPGNTSLRRRMMEKYRQVIDERKRLQRILRVQDYYNLGYLHYTAGEFPQTAIVTGEGLRLVRMGPKQYLHYLKAMSHYQIAVRASEPLPADTTADSTARVRGAQFRAELDREGRRRAVAELRRAITEFSHMLSSPELEPSAREWILRCNEQIGSLAAGN
jgi:hypothetical protein